MADTIGKCECINNFDKSEIDHVITNDIDDADYKLTLMRRDRKELIESGVNTDELTRKYESEKSKLKNLLLRVRNTPVCK